MSEEENLDGIELFNIKELNDEELILFADTALREAGDNLTSRGQAIRNICEKIFEVKDPVQYNLFIDTISKKHRISKKIINEQLKLLRTSSAQADEKIKDPLEDYIGIDKAAAKQLGFFTNKNSYYFLTKDGVMKGSNFIIRPLFHIYSKSDNKRLIEIINEDNHSRIIDVPSKFFVSPELFAQVAVAEGNFLLFGSKFHFMKILSSIFDRFPVCNELKTLGWQREGFYAFANGIYNGKWQPVDELGITTHNSKNYFSPAFSTVYNNVREDDDEYESDRYFIYQLSPITFDKWSRLMIEVYGDNGIIAIAYIVATIFRDLIYEKYKMFPHLFLFGEKQSGKSQLAWSMSSFFFNNMPAFNLSSGTQVGFARRNSRVKNALAWYDEYSNDIDPRRIQTLKSSYDGMGHEKGKATKDNRTEITKVNSSNCISGQYLPTTDDNALLTRSILLSFEKKIYSQEAVARYDELKMYEQKGISSLVCDILDYRKTMEECYPRVFSDLMDQVKAELTEEHKPFDERLVKNFCSVLAPVKIVLESGSPLRLNFSFEKIYSLAKKMIPELSKQISSSESLANFWMMMEYMLDNKLIEKGNDFEVRSVTSLKAVNKKGDNEVLTYSTPKMVLFVRFSKIHPTYLDCHRRQFGRNGVDMVSLLHYIKHHQSFIGSVSSYRFENSVSSCYAFDYELLQVNLERNQRIQGEDEKPF